MTNLDALTELLERAAEIERASWLLIASTGSAPLKQLHESHEGLRCALGILIASMKAEHERQIFTLQLVIQCLTSEEKS
jgi:hypothetical protein